MAPKTIWEPHPGGQTYFMKCPSYECLYEGTRGGGKTDALVMDFAQHVGCGFGAYWRGILFRRTYVQLADVVARTRRHFSQIFPSATYSQGSHTWTFEDGEQLLLRYFERVGDYWNYHGHEYPWMAWEELTNWESQDGYEKMKSCVRSSFPGMPRKIRSTCNPWGIGHHWVKRYFIDPAPQLTVIRNNMGEGRVRITGDVKENEALLEADPDYIKRLDSITDQELKRAWRYGSWDIAAGGVFSDVWKRDKHIVPPFTIPRSWYVDRSFDWGSASPFSVLWWAESDGTEVVFKDMSSRSWPRGTLFLIGEWYGDDGEEKGIRMTARSIGKEILAREASMDVIKGMKVRAGPADNQIYEVVDGHCIAKEFEKSGVTWTRSNKGPGSRVNGLQLIHDRLAAATETHAESPGLHVFSTCPRWISHVPVVVRDERKLEDIADGQPDHDYDASRYRLLAPRGGISINRSLRGVSHVRR